MEAPILQVDRIPRKGVRRTAVRVSCWALGVCALALTVGIDTRAFQSRLANAGPESWTDDLSPLPDSAWSAELAAHLLERAGFGGTLDTIARFTVMTPEQAVAALVDYDVIADGHLPRFEDSYVWDEGMDPFPESHAEAASLAREHGHALGVRVEPDGTPGRLQPVVDKYFYGVHANAIEVQRLGVWWMARMLATPRPLEEKLTLLWHGHFATSARDVRDVRLVERQHALFRRFASGNFGQLLDEISRDPATLVALGNRANTKSHPDDRFARALLEHFTLGAGHFSSLDVTAAARAFTGWTVDGVDFAVEASEHDEGEKRFLGRTGPLDGDGIVEILLEQPATAEKVAAAVYRFFVREEVGSTVRAALGRTLRQNGYRLKPLLRHIFLSKDFYSHASMATQVKSPVALLVSTYKKMGLTSLPTIPDPMAITTRLGQALFDPPTGAGWVGGRAWLAGPSGQLRAELLREILSADVASFQPPDRLLPPLEARVADNLARGLDVAAATADVATGATSSALGKSDHEFNERYGSYRGYVLALERTKHIARQPLAVDLTSWLRAARATTAEAAVDHLLYRFLRQPATARAREELIELLRHRLGTGAIADGPSVEPALRELLERVCALPAFQFG